MKTLEFVLILILGGFLALAVRDDLGQRAGRALSDAALVVATNARGGETAAANRSQAACVGEGRAGVRAGLAIAHAAAVDPTPRTMITAGELNDVAAP